ncbi:MAG TPA: YdiU family protein [Pyrinomonadaceae bacterium]|nr:YdiU family protein [Pyrinomonadaceae bacterium]
MRKLNELAFDNTYARLPAAFYSKVSPTPFPDPYLVSFNPAAAELIDLDPREAERPEFVEYFGGGRTLTGAEPLAMLYAGHQFGSYVPQLGDGRAILLGEVRNARGEKWDLHLKGGGPTPYSRGFDGRAVLRSTIREYLCGEAMHALGIPSSRALCIVGSDEPVRRESMETAAALVRMSESHVRFGTFEVFYYRRQPERVRELADYVIANHFPELAGAADKYQQFLLEVARRTARLIAKWQAVGFAHGVMNTDNMSVLGLTLDYGPFGFLDDYQAGFICNHSDYSGRYAFDRQPAVGLWNASRLAQTLVNLITVEEATAALDAYQPAFAAHYGELMRAKLGLTTETDADAQLLLSLLGLLEANGVDYTNFFRRLGDFRTTDDAQRHEHLRDMFVEPAAFDAWAAGYRQRLLAESSEDAARKSRMDAVNPKYVLRNYLAQNAITAAVERRDYTEIERLFGVLRAPFTEQPGREGYAESPPDWGKRLAVSCSS